MQPTYDLTVVVPVHNRIEHFKQTMASFFNAPDLGVSHQFIVVDDTSNEPGLIEAINAMPLAVEYQRLNRGDSRWRNPSRPLNVGIRRALGTVTVICHSGIVPRAGALYDLYGHIMDDSGSAHLARIEENGVEVSGSQRPYFLFGGMLTAPLQHIRGYDEDFTEYGYEDDDLAFRLHMMGFGFKHHPTIIANHLPHERHDLGAEMERMRQIHYRKMALISTGEISVIRNLDREWGALWEQK